MARIAGWFTSGRLYAIGTLLLLCVAIARLVPTYTLFNETSDEPFHIACGMEWLDQGTYTYERQHPPLARVAMALGPYLMGSRSQGLKLATQEGNAILYSGGDYWRTLTAARIGNLPFLVIACAAIFLWGRRWFTTAAGFWAALLFLNLPPVLGHAGLATLDMACTAAVVVALYQLMRCLEDPGWRRFLWLGVALSLAFLTKFSAPGFVLVCGVTAVVYLVLARRQELAKVLRLRPLLGGSALMLGVIFVLLWAGYRFHLTPTPIEEGSQEVIDAHLPAGVRNLAYAIAELPLPLTDMFRGFGALALHQKTGHENYLFGQFSQYGWWYFFPVALAVKTPIPFLLLSFAGLFLVLRGMRSRPWPQVLTALFPIAILLTCLSSSIDIGVRHLLPIYPFLALLAGNAIANSLEGRRPFIAGAALLLAGWTVAESWIAHPDYLAYFNQLAGSRPERILCDSDLDWGQDLNRLSKRLRELGVDRVAIAYFGNAPLERFDLPQLQPVMPYDETTGYVAISVRALYLTHAQRGYYDWLWRHQPVERIGKSIYLYDIK